MLFGSQARTKLLLAIFAGSKTLGELGSLTKLEPQNANKRIHELIRDGLVRREARGSYRITPIGKLACRNMQSFIQLLKICKKLKDYLSTHRVEVIPENLLESMLLIPDLKVAPSGANPFELQHFIVDIFKAAESRLIGISPLVTPEWAEAAQEMAEQGVKVSIVMNEDVLEKLRGKNYKNYRLLSHPNLEFYLSSEISFGFVSNGAAIALAFNGDEGFDLQNRLIASGAEAVKWGEGLFKYYAKNI